MERIDTIEAMKRRHAIRDFSDRLIDPSVLNALQEAIAQANSQSELNIQLIHDETDAFGGCPTHYGRFKNVRYCIALIGRDETCNDDHLQNSRTNNNSHDNVNSHDKVSNTADNNQREASHRVQTVVDHACLDERIGYYGEQLALLATQLGLDTGWAVLHETSEHNGQWHMNDDERMPAVIAIGYGTRPGRPHRSKPLTQLGTVEHGATERAEGDDSVDNNNATLAGAPEWFLAGLEAVALAPSALGKQPVFFTLLADGRVRAEALDGVQSEICLGVAKYHFVVGSGRGSDIFVKP